MTSTSISESQEDMFYWEKLPRSTGDIGIAGSNAYIKYPKTATRNVPKPTPKPLLKDSDWVETGASDWISIEAYAIYPTPKVDSRWKPAGDGTFVAAVDPGNDGESPPTAYYNLPIDPEPRRNEIQLEYRVPLCNGPHPEKILHGYGGCSRLNSTLCISTAPSVRGQHFCRPQHENVNEFRNIFFFEERMNESWWHPSVQLRPDIQPGTKKVDGLYDFYAGEVVLTRYGPLWSEDEQAYEHLADKGLSSAATVGIAVGVSLAFLAPLAISVHLWRKRRARNRAKAISAGGGNDFDNDAVFLQALMYFKY